MKAPYVNLPLATLVKFRASSARASLAVFMELANLATDEIALSPPHMTACGLIAERAGIVLGGGMHTDYELAARIGYSQRSFRSARDVLKKMGLIVTELGQHGYRLAILGCHKFRTLASASPRHEWIARALGRTGEVDDERQLREEEQVVEVDDKRQRRNDNRQPADDNRQPGCDSALRSQQVTDPKSKKKSEKKLARSLIVKERTTLVASQTQNPEPILKELSEDFQPDGGNRDYAAKYGLDLEEELAAFSDMHRSIGNERRNWNQVFQAHLANVVASHGLRPKVSLPEKPAPSIRDRREQLQAQAAAWQAAHGQVGTA